MLYLFMTTCYIRLSYFQKYDVQLFTGIIVCMQSLVTMCLIFLTYLTDCLGTSLP